MLASAAPVKPGKAEASWSIWNGEQTYLALLFDAGFACKTRGSRVHRLVEALQRLPARAAIASQHAIQKSALSPKNSVALQD